MEQPGSRQRGDIHMGVVKEDMQIKDMQMDDGRENDAGDREQQKRIICFGAPIKGRAKRGWRGRLQLVPGLFMAYETRHKLTSVHSEWPWTMVDEQSASSRLLPWPCVAVVAAHAGVADRGSSQRPGPPGVSVSHNILCRAPPCTCAESAGNPPYPAGKRGGTKKGTNVSRPRAKFKERMMESVMHISSVSFSVLNQMLAFKGMILHLRHVKFHMNHPPLPGAATDSVTWQFNQDQIQQ